MPVLTNCKTENIPENLKAKARFALWRYENKGGKKTKSLYNSRSGKHITPADKFGFVDYNSAVSKTWGYDGLVVVLADDLCAIDIAHCISEGHINETASDIVNIMRSYAEVTVEGDSIRILFYAPAFTRDYQARTLAEQYYLKGNPALPGVEVCAAEPKGRCVTLSGNKLNIIGVEERDAEVRAVLEKYMKRTAEQPETPPETAAENDSVTEFEAFLEKIKGNAFCPISTGMAELDQLLDGGLQPGSLVVLQSDAGMGKTTFCQQIFESIAADGRNVVFLNLEMSKEQLLARSLSRAAKKCGVTIPAASVLRGYGWTSKQREMIEAVAATYKESTAPRMRYRGGKTKPTVASIANVLRAQLEKARAENLPAPMLVLDHLQALKAEGYHSQQEAIKALLYELKSYAIAGDTVAFVVSALEERKGKQSARSPWVSEPTAHFADTLLHLDYSDAQGGRIFDELNILGNPGTRRLALTVAKQRNRYNGGKLELIMEGDSGLVEPTVKEDPFEEDVFKDFDVFGVNNPRDVQKAPLDCEE